MYDPARDVFKRTEERTSSGNQKGHDDRESASPGHNSKKLQACSHSKLRFSHSSADRFAQKQAGENGTSETNSLLPGSKSDNSNLTFRENSPMPHSAMPDNLPDDSLQRKRKAERDVESDSKRTKIATNGRNASRYDSPLPMTTTNLPRFSKRRVDPRADPTGASPISDQRLAPRGERDRARVSRSPDHPDRPARQSGWRRDRRTPQPRRSRSPQSRRSPTPPPRSPPRQRKRPGGASRMTAQEKEHGRQILLEREQAQKEQAKRDAAERGVSDVVRQHYNLVPERGRQWRNTDSRIKGLRSLNNWIKSAIIQRYSPNEDFDPHADEEPRWAEEERQSQGLKVLDIGCGKGGDLGKWQKAPQRVGMYVGVDPAEVSISQARDRYRELKEGGGRGRRGGRDQRDSRPPKVFHGEFYAQDAFGKSLGSIPLIQQIGFDDGSGDAMSRRWGGGGGFDVVSMMFCMHYAFESEEKARGMLQNVSGSLKKGGRLIGTIPNSDVISEKAIAFHKAKSSPGAADATKAEDAEPEEGEAEEVLEWGNSIYRVRFPGKTPDDGIFRPIYGWKYSFFLEEAVEEVPEYVVPFGAFRGMAEDYNLELRYMKPFKEVWKENNNDAILGPLSEQMRVRERNGGSMIVSDDEFEAAGFYMAFCFYKT
ncbi:MAG: mRNA cap guanine-N7 methyltransferase [Vezdaea aestivalis]|nr:MAG: mRNA cap guanine-N7 methyltransferase [Vezdaea aestivalis]